jgi:hypothetical protein
MPAGPALMIATDDMGAIVAVVVKLLSSTYLASRGWQDQGGGVALTSPGGVSGANILQVLFDLRLSASPWGEASSSRADYDMSQSASSASSI